MPDQGGSILDVLKGKESVKLEISISASSIAYLGIAILLAVAVGVFIGQKAS